MSDAAKWDARYQGELARTERPPDAFVVEMVERLGPARGRRALDLASGTGRHALLLARSGWRTSAWDVSSVALGIASERAETIGVALDTRCIDLATEPLPAERFALVVVVDFLDRSLLSRLAALLEPGGHALVTTFTEDWPEPHPSARFRLARGELARGLPGLRSIDARESGGRAALCARRDRPT